MSETLHLHLEARIGSAWHHVAERMHNGLIDLGPLLANGRRGLPADASAWTTICADYDRDDLHHSTHWSRAELRSLLDVETLIGLGLVRLCDEDSMDGVDDLRVVAWATGYSAFR